MQTTFRDTDSFIDLLTGRFFDMLNTIIKCLERRKRGEYRTPGTGEVWFVTPTGSRRSVTLTAPSTR